MNWDVGEVTERLENEQSFPSLHLRHSSFSNPSFAFPISWALLILQPFCHFTYVPAHSPTIPSLYLGHSSFSNPSVASSTSQLILQTFFRFSYVTGSSPGEPPMIKGMFFLRIFRFPCSLSQISFHPHNMRFILFHFILTSDGERSLVNQRPILWQVVNEVAFIYFILNLTVGYARSELRLHLLLYLYIIYIYIYKLIYTYINK